MNKKTVINQLKQLQVFHRSNGTMVLHRNRESIIRKVLLDDGLSLESYYFNSNKVGRCILGDSLQLRKWSSPNGSNLCLRHIRNNMQVQHTCIRFYNTCKELSKLLVVSLNDATNGEDPTKPYVYYRNLNDRLDSPNPPEGTQEANKPQDSGIHTLQKANQLLPTNNKSDMVTKILDGNKIENNDLKEALGEMDASLNQVFNTSYLSIGHFPVELSARFSNDGVYSSTSCNISSTIKKPNQLMPSLGDHSLVFCYKIDIRRLHTNVKQLKAVEVNKTVRAGGLESGLSKDVACDFKRKRRLSKSNEPNTVDMDLSEDARKLLYDLDITNQQKNNAEAGENKRTSKKRRKEVREGGDCDVDYEKCKHKPFSIDSRVWSNYLQSSSHMHANTLRQLSNKWRPDTGNVDYALVTKTKYSFFRELANSLLKLFRRQDEQNLSERYNSKWLRSAWYKDHTNVMSSKRSRYNFTIKHDYLKNKTRKVLRPKCVTINRKCSMEIVAEDINRKYDSEADKANMDKCKFMAQFKRRSENIKLYNSVINLNKDSDFENNPEMLLRFCHVMKKVIKNMDSVVTKEDGKELSKSIHMESDTNDNLCTKESMSTYDMEKAMRVPENLEELSRCQLYSIKDQENSSSFKDTCLHVKIKPLSKTSRFADIQIEDMRVEVAEMEASDKSLTATSPDKLNLTAAKHDKCLLLNLKLKLPFSSDDFTRN